MRHKSCTRFYQYILFIVLLFSSVAVYAASTLSGPLSKGIAPNPLSAGTTNNALIGWALKSSDGDIFTGINIQTSSASAGKLINFKLYRSTDNDYSTAGNNTEITGISIIVTATEIQISGLNEALTGSNQFYFLVADVDPSVTEATPNWRPTFNQSNVVVSSGSVGNKNVAGTNYSFYSYCSSAVPSHNVDLTGSPSGEWISISEPRGGICCGLNSGPPDNVVCVEFFVTLDPGSQGINFTINSGAEPSGAMGWQLNCELPERPVGEDICLDGIGPHRITFCKPGNNPNSYSIRSIARPSVSDPVVVSDGCTSTLTAAGFEPSSIVWSSDPFNATHNSYLSCTSQCTTTVATYQADAPLFVDYQVTGTPLGGCDLTPVTRTTRVYFVNDKTADIEPQEPTICYGGNFTTLTAVGTGGAPPYTYLWSTGETTQTINVNNVGTYSVTISDSTSCPPASADRNVTAYLSPIVADAGPDVSSCTNNPNVTLNGSVSQATGGVWSGGAGNYLPSNTDLVVTYEPTPAEIAAEDPITHTLTTTGNGSCPAESDQAIQTFILAPTIDLGPSQSRCANNPDAFLNAVVNNNPDSYTWTGGNGTFFPNRDVLDPRYTPTQDEIDAGFVDLTFTASKASCIDVSDVIRINYTPAPTAIAGPPQTVCANNAEVSLSGSVTVATQGSWSTNGSGSFGNASLLNTTYDPSPADISATSVTLTLTTTDNGNCLAVSDQVVISFVPTPIVNAGTDRTVCANNATLTLNGSVTHAPGGTWSGGGTFSSNTDLSATYTPSQGEIDLGTATLTLTSDDVSNCIPVTDQMVITINPAPIVNAGIDQTVCSNNAQVTLSGTVQNAGGGAWSVGTGSYAPGSNVLNPTYQPDPAEISNGSVTLTLTSTGNGLCNPVSDQMTIFFTPSPVVDAGPDQTVCANNSAVVLAGSVSGGSTTGQWSGHSGTFGPGSSTTLNATYNPSQTEINAGSVTLTLTSTANGNCNSVSDQVTITITPAPVVDAGNNRVVCANNPSLTLSGSVTGGATTGVWSGGGTFDNANLLNAQYTPSQAEINASSATLTLTSTGNGSCLAVSDQMVITITPAPVADAGNDEIVCSNNTTVTLSGSVQVAAGGAWVGDGTFIPNNSTLNATYMPSQAEIDATVAALILVTTGNGNCLPHRDTMLVIITPAPVVDAGPDQNICSNNPLINLSGTVQNGPTTNAWSGGTPANFGDNSLLNTTYNPTQAEIDAATLTLTLTANRPGCNPVSDQVTINFTPAPEVDAGPPQTVCANNPGVNLSGTVTVATGGTWTGGGTFGNPNSLITTYTPSPGEIDAGTATLTLTSTDNGNCIAVSDQVVITITEAPTVNAGPDQTVCANNANVTLAGSVTIATGGRWTGGGGNYLPNDVTLNATYIPSDAEKAAGTATLTLTTTGNGNCLAVSDEMTITITPAPTVNTGGNQSVCANNAQLALGGSVTVATGGTWLGGAGNYNPDRNTLNAIYTPTASEIQDGSVTLTLVSTGNGNCNFVSAEKVITITPGPTVNAGNDQLVCGDVNNIPLSGSVTVATGGTWTTSGTGSFNPNANTLTAAYEPSLTDKLPGNTVTLTLTSTGNGNCNAVSDQVDLTFTLVPTLDAGPDQTVCTNNLPVQLNASGSPGSWSGGGGTFSPDNNAHNATYTPTQAEIDAQTVTLTFTTTPSGACPVRTDDVVITIPPGPVANAGPDQTVCADIGLVQLNGAVSGTATGGTWTRSGTGTFSDASVLNATYDPSPADRDAGTVTLTLTTTGTGSCLPHSDQMILTITPAPVANAGPDQTVCADVNGVQLNGQLQVATQGAWSSTGDGTFDPGNNALNAIYRPTANDTTAGSVTLTLLTLDNGTCNPVSDQMVITITPAPVVNAGSDRTICADADSINISGIVYHASGGLWSSSGTGTFSPNNALLNTSYYPSPADTANGTVTLTLTSDGNGTCNAVSDQMILNITPVPVVNAGPDVTACGDVNQIILNGASMTVSTSGTWTTFGTGFFDNPNVINATYNLSNQEKEGGVVTLRLTSTDNGTCNTYFDQMVITITEPPTANAGLDRTICADATGLTLNGAVTIATGGRWSTDGDGSFDDEDLLNAFYTPGPTDRINGTVILTLTTTGNGTCNPVSDDMELTITPAPTADAGPDQEVCSDVTGVPLSGAVAIATQGEWATSGNGTFSLNDNDLTGTYVPTPADKAATFVILTLTTVDNGTCNPVSDQMRIDFTPAPTADAGLNQTVCADVGRIQLSGAVTIAEGGQWSTTGTGSFDPDDEDLDAEYILSPEDIDAGSVVLTLTTTGNGTCNAVFDNMSITITPAPTVNAGPDRTICADVDAIVLGGTVTTATGGNWSTTGEGSFNPGATTLNAIYNIMPADKIAGTITFTLFTTGNGTCIPVSDDFVLTITPAPTVDAGDDQAICADLNGTPLNGSVVNALGGRWNTSGNGSFFPNEFDLNADYAPSPDDKAAGSVTLTLVTEGVGTCIPVSDEMVISIAPIPIVDAGADRTVCADNPVVNLNGTVLNAGGGTWSTASGTGTFDPNADALNALFTPSPQQITNGLAILTLTSTGNGTCNPVTDQMRITINPAPVVDAGPDQDVCADRSSVTLNGTFANADGIIWSTSGMGSFDPDDVTLGAIYDFHNNDKIAGTITLTLTSTGNGLCNAVSDTKVINITPAPTVDAGPAVICSADPIQLNGQVTVAASGTWTTSGNGNFTPSADGLNPVYDPVGDAGTVVTLTLTTTGNGDCQAVSDQISFSVNPPPSANAGLDRVRCANAGGVVLNGSVVGATGGTWTSSGGGPFTPDADQLNATYTPSFADIANGSATLTLTTTGVGICDAASDQMIITVTPAPTANAGPDQTVCADLLNVQLNGSVTIATGGTWSTTGDGSFNNANLLNATYSPGANDRINGTVTLTLTTTGNGGCVAVSDQMIITITPAPTLDGGPDITICGDVNAYFLDATVTVATGGTWTTSGSGSFTSFGDPVDIRYNISPDDKIAGTVTLTVTTTGNGTCQAISDDVILTITPVPTVTATAASGCSDQPSIPLTGAIAVATQAQWHTSGTGSFDPNDMALSPAYIPSQDDIDLEFVTLVLITLDHGMCNPVSDTIDINILPAPAADAGPDQIVCADINGVLMNGVISNAGGGIWSTSGTGTFDDPELLNATYSLSDDDIEAGSVTLTLTTTDNDICNEGVDQMLITITPAPTVSANPGIICITGLTPSVDLIGTMTVSTTGIWTTTGSGDILPNNTSMNITYELHADDYNEGSILLTLTTTDHGTCNPVSFDVLVNIADAPQANGGGNQTICADAGEVILNGSVNNAGGGVWSTLGSGTFEDFEDPVTRYFPSDADTAAHSVRLVLTTTDNGVCGPTRDTILITINPIPIVNAGPASFCSDAAIVPINGSVLHAGGGIWSTLGGGSFDNPNQLSTTYEPVQADRDAGSVVLILTSDDMGSCNAVSDQIILNLLPAPTANAGADVTVCADAGTVQLSGLIEGNASGGRWTSSGNGSFLPDDEDMNAVYQLTPEDTTAGMVTIILTAEGTGVCDGVSDEKIITITPAPVVIAGPDQTVCADIVTVNLSGNMTVATQSLWTTSGSGSFDDEDALITTYEPSAQDKIDGTVILTLTTVDPGDCNPVSDQLTITITPAPTVDAGPSSICADDEGIPVSAVFTVAEGVTWSAASVDGYFAPNPDATSPLYIASDDDRIAGFVDLTVTTRGNGTCIPVSDMIRINLVPPPAANAGSDITVCADQNDITLNGIVTGAALSGEWSGGDGSFGSATPVATYTIAPEDRQAGSIVLTLTTTGNAPCNAHSDQMVLSFVTAPSANAGPDQTICADNRNVLLSGSVQAAGGGQWSTSGSGSFSPGINNLSPTYHPSNGDTLAGTVILTLTTTGTGLCNPASDQMVLTITDAPTVNAGPDQIVCADITSVNLSGVVTTAGGGRWTTSGNGSFSLDTDLNATYTPSPEDIADNTVILTLTTIDNGQCNAVSDNMVITITPAPTVDAGFNRTICADAGTVTMDGSVTVAEGGLWSTFGDGSFDYDTAMAAVYTPSQNDIDNGSVVLRLTSTGNGTCNPVFDDMLVTITEAPVISAGGNDVICADAGSYVLNGSVTVATGVTWSTTGNGLFSPNEAATIATYFITPEDTAAGSLTFTVVSTGNGTCQAVTDQMTLTINPAPVVNAGEDIIACADVTSVNLSGAVFNATGGEWSGASNAFSNSLDLNATYFPTQADKNAGTIILTLTSTGMGTCNPVTDHVRITFTEAPTVFAGFDQSICADASGASLNGSVTVATGGIWTTSGLGTFFPDDTTLTASYIPDASEKPGTVTLRLTTTGNGTCMAVFDEMTLTITPAPTVNAGANQTICADAEGAVLNGSVTVATGGIWTTSGSGTFSPNAATLNATYVHSDADKAAGTIGLTLTTTGNGTCNEVRSSMVLTITPIPTVSAGPDRSICADAANVSLNGSVTVATGGTWSSSGNGSFGNINALNTTYSPSPEDRAAGTVHLRLTTTGNGTCNAYSDEMVLTITPAPTVNVGPDRTVCADVGGTPLNGVVTVATGGTWTTSGSGSFSPGPNVLNPTYNLSNADTTAGSVVLTLTTTGNGTCQAYNDQITINITPTPIVSTGAGTICSDVTGLTLEGSVLHATGAVWSTSGSGTFAPNAHTLNASYTPSQQDIDDGIAILRLTSTGMGTCNPVFADMTVIITPLPESDAGPDQVVCRGASTDLFAKAVPEAVAYAWFQADGTHVSDDFMINITANDTVSYVLRVTDVKGCSTTDTVTVFVIDPPSFNMSDQVCFAKNLLLNSDPSVTPEFGVFQWFRNDTLLMTANNPTYTVSQPGMHQIEYSFDRCAVYDSIDVTTAPALSTLDRIACAGSGLTLSVSSIPSAGNNYFWSFNGSGVGGDAPTLNIVTLLDTNRYYVSVSDGFGCVSTDSIDVVGLLQPVLNISDISVCVGTSVELDARPTNIVNIDALDPIYEWSYDGVLINGSVSDTLNVSANGMYKVILTISECVTADSSYVQFNPLPVSVNETFVEHCLEDGPAQLDAGPGASYLWEESGNTAQFETAFFPGFYYVTIYNEFNCSVEDTIELRDVCPPRIFYPTAFLPGSGGVNGEFKIYGKYFTNFSLTIFNRWGEIIFHTKDPDHFWDGTYRGELMPIGVYPWVITYDPIHPKYPKPEPVSGSITIIR